MPLFAPRSRSSSVNPTPSSTHLEAQPVSLRRSATSTRASRSRGARRCGSPRPPRDRGAALVVREAAGHGSRRRASSRPRAPAAGRGGPPARPRARSPAGSEDGSRRARRGAAASRPASSLQPRRRSVARVAGRRRPPRPRSASTRSPPAPARGRRGGRPRSGAARRPTPRPPGRAAPPDPPASAAAAGRAATRAAPGRARAGPGSRRAARRTAARSSRPVEATALARWYVSKRSGVPSEARIGKVHLVQVSLSVLEPVLRASTGRSAPHGSRRCEARPASSASSGNVDPISRGSSEYTIRPPASQSFTRTTRSPSTRSLTSRSTASMAAGRRRAARGWTAGSTIPCPASSANWRASRSASSCARLRRTSTAGRAEDRQDDETPRARTAPRDVSQGSLQVSRPSSHCGRRPGRPATSSARRNQRKEQSR